MNNKEELENSKLKLLVITNHGKLVRLFCPFVVRVLISTDGLKEGETHKVESVRMGDIKLLYVIANQPYYHTFFMILPKKH